LADDHVDWKLGDLSEKMLESRSVFDGVFLHVKRDIVSLSDGTRTRREYIIHPGAVVIIAMSDEGQLVLERQFRYPLGREFIELPAGKIDPGESPLVTAQRELAEETGYRAERWRHLGRMHPGIGYSTESIEIYLAEGLSKSAAKLDPGEFLEVFTLSLDTAIAWIRSGRITDSKTITALLWAEKVYRGEWS